MGNFLSVISKYRGELMGFAAIWIIIFHLHIEHYVDNSIISFLCGIGRSGVDLFLFLSGFGLYYSSYNKKQTKSEFYKRRLQRIYCTFIPFLLISIVIGVCFFGDHVPNIKDLLLKIPTLDFWIYGDLSYWYIGAILVFYISYPFFLSSFNKNEINTLILVCVISLILTLIEHFMDGSRMLFTTRIPIFFLGVLFGKLSLEKKIKNQTALNVLLILMAFVSLSGFYILNSRYRIELEETGLLWYFACFYSVGLVFLLCYFFRFTDSRFKIINKIALFIGNMSLEVYLFHIMFFNYKHHIMAQLDVNLKMAYAISLVLTIILSYILSKSVKFFSTKFIKDHKQKV